MTKTVSKTTNPVTLFASNLAPYMGEDSENSFFSPFSIMTALGMCSAGAKGATKKALLQMLLSSEEVEDAQNIFKSLVDEVNSEEERPFELTTANALWGAEGMDYVDNFASTIKENYGGEFVAVDFENKPETAVGMINAWCDEHTNGKINQIITRDFINSDTRLILTNAIYFLGKWAKKFQKVNTYPDVWQTATGKARKAKADFMHMTTNVSYAENENFTAIDLPYMGDELSMLVVLPKENSEDALNCTWSEVYDELTSTLVDEKVNITLPKFEMETKYNMGETLKDLGAGVAFSDSADFTGIAKDEVLKISEVIHKAYVKCDEEGTEAAAVTAVGMMRCTSVRPADLPKEFKADHPFMFFIRNCNSGNILFCGRVMNP